MPPLARNCILSRASQRWAAEISRLRCHTSSECASLTLALKTLPFVQIQRTIPTLSGADGASARRSVVALGIAWLVVSARGCNPHQLHRSRKPCCGGAAAERRVAALGDAARR